MPLARDHLSSSCVLSGRRQRSDSVRESRWEARETTCHTESSSWRAQVWPDRCRDGSRESPVRCSTRPAAWCHGHNRPFDSVLVREPVPLHIPPAGPQLPSTCRARAEIEASCKHASGGYPYPSVPVLRHCDPNQGYIQSTKTGNNTADSIFGSQRCDSTSLSAELNSLTRVWYTHPSHSMQGGFRNDNWRGNGG